MPNEPNLAARGASCASTPAPSRSEPPLREPLAGSLVGQTVGLDGAVSAPRPAPAGRGSSFAPCGHSACRQNWIDTGEIDCVDGEIEHTGAGPAQTAGPHAGESSRNPRRPGATFLMLVWSLVWLIGMALCVASVCLCYLLVAAAMGAL